MDHALSNREIDAFLKKDNLRTIMYDELEHMTLDDIFTPTAQYAIILYTSDVRKVGHYVCILNYGRKKNGRFLIEYFNSAGNAPDETNAALCVDPQLKKRKFITNLLRGCDVIVNKVAVQSPNTSTCGRHVILRCLSYGTKLCDYLKILKGNKHFTPDEIVSMLVKIRI